MKRSLLLLLLLLPLTVRAQGGKITQDPWVSSRQGNPVAGATIAVCQPLTTTAASLTSTLATFTMSSNPITAGYVTGMQVQIFGFTGADTYFNQGTLTDGFLTGGVPILSVTSTQIIAGPIVHVNGSATTTGSVLQLGNSVTPCAGLSTIYTDALLGTVQANPFLADSMGNYSAGAPSGIYYVQIYGGGITTTLRQVVVGGGTGSGPIFNGTCIVNVTQSPQNCINSFPSGNGDVFIPAGTWNTTSAIVINGTGQSGIHIRCAGGNSSIIQYTGSGAIAAVIDIGTATPTVNLLNHIVIDGCVVRGNANVTHAIRLQGVNSSFLVDVDGRDVTGSALQWLFGVGNVVSHWMTTPNDGIGAFTTTPTGCMELGELGANFGFTTTTFLTPRCEAINGTAISMKNAAANSMSACQVTTNVTALDIEQGVSTNPSLNNSFNSCLFENSSATDAVILGTAALQNFFYDSMVTIGTGQFHIKGSNNFIEGGQVGTMLIDNTAVNTHLTQVSMSRGNFTNNGINTNLRNNFEPLSGKQWMNTQATYTQIIPGFQTSDGLVGGTGYDPQDHPNQGCWDFSTVARIISSTTLTTGKPWRAIFIGQWANNTDGAGLAQLPEYIEVTSVANTLAVGTLTVTFTVSGSGLFQAVTGASNVSFCGTIYMQPNTNNAAGTSSISVKGDITDGTTHSGAYTSTAAASSVEFNVVSGNAFRSGSAGGSYFFDLGNVTVRNGNAANTGAVLAVDGPIVSSSALPCTNAEIGLSAGWQSTGAATVTAVTGQGQTCSWLITTGTTTAANPTITDTLTNSLPTALVQCWVTIHNGTAATTIYADQTTLSATAPVFTVTGTPSAAGATYRLIRQCGP